MEQTQNKDFKTVLYGDIMPKVYGIGASIVIAGAMFKILNWPGANLMIGMGLTTEAMIFFLSAFEPVSKEYDWSKVYPQLDPDYEGPITAGALGQIGGSNEYQKELTNLAKTIKKLNEIYIKEIEGISAHLGDSSKLYISGNKTLEEMSKASKEAEEFRIELEKLRGKIASLNEIYDNTLNALRR